MKNVRSLSLRCPKRRRRGQLSSLKQQQQHQKDSNAQTSSVNEDESSKRGKKKKQQPTVSVIPVEDDVEEEEPTAVDFEPQTVSVTSCLVVISSFVIGGAILFSIWEVISSETYVSIGVKK